MSVLNCSLQMENHSLISENSWLHHINLPGKIDHLPHDLVPCPSCIPTYIPGGRMSFSFFSQGHLSWIWPSDCDRAAIRGDALVFWSVGPWNRTGAAWLPIINHTSRVELYICDTSLTPGKRLPAPFETIVKSEPWIKETQKGRFGRRFINVAFRGELDLFSLSSFRISWVLKLRIGKILMGKVTAALCYSFSSHTKLWQPFCEMVNQNE